MGTTLAAVRDDRSWLAIALACALAGAAVPLFPPLLLVPVAALVGAGLLVSPLARGAFVVMGGIVAFQSSEGLSAPKAVYMAGVAAAAVGALLSWRALSEPLRRTLMPILVASGALVLVTFASIVPALANGATPNDWMRDASTYLLLALAPLFALDLATATPRNIVRLLVVAGGVATITFSATWLRRRGLTELPLDEFALSSIMLAAAFFSFAVASAFTQQRRHVWVFAVAVAATLVLITGTRSGLMLLIAPLLIVLVPGFTSPARVGQLAVGVVSVVGLIAVLLVASGRLFPTEQQRVQERIETTTATVLSDPTYDASYRERQVTTTLAWETFAAAPLVGVGPGHRFVYTVPYATGGSRLRDPLILDTALVTAAKFGLIGSAPLMLLVAGVMLFAWRLLRVTRSRTGLALVGYLGILAAALVLASPFDDKGFSFSLLMFLALGVSEWRRAEAEAEAEADQPATGTPGSALAR